MVLALMGCQALPPERDTNEQEQAIQAAQAFLQAFIDRDAETVLRHSSLPFWGDGYILSSLEDLKAELEPQLKDNPPPIKVVGSRFYSTDDLAFLWPKLAAKLQREGFPQGSHAVIVAIAEPTDLEDEKLILLVRRNPAGQWSVSGIDEY